MKALAYSNAIGFAVGAGVGFGLSGSLRLMEEGDKLPGDMEYNSAQPIGLAAFAEFGKDYAGVISGEKIIDLFGDNLGFIAGAATGTYLSEKTFDFSNDIYSSDLEEFYRENDLDDIWEDVKEEHESYIL